MKCKHSLVMAEAGERWALRSPWVSGAELWVGEQELMEGIQKAGKAEVRCRARSLCPPQNVWPSWTEQGIQLGKNKRKERSSQAPGSRKKLWPSIRFLVSA